MLSLSKHISHKIVSFSFFAKRIQGAFAMTLLLVSCAQIVPITGGDKDVEPPKEKNSEPQNGSTNFIDKTISIEFNEFIKLNNLHSQLIVSPLMETPPEIVVKGKKLVIKIASELKENTTYSINFGNAIADITENNVFPNYKYVFSTGSYIDSLSYSGSVVSAFDLTQKEGVYVLLYDQLEDSVPLKELPRYIAITNKKGEFSITNIAHGMYKFFAIKDINSNYLFDLPNEEIAFKNEIIHLDSSSSDNIIHLFEEENKLQYVKEAENKTYGKVDVKFNKPTKNLSITPLNQFFKTKFYIEEKSINGDNLTLWLKTTEGVKTLELLLKDEYEIIDTVNIDILNRSEFKDSSLQITTNISGVFDLNKSILLTTVRPISQNNFEKIKFYEDSNLVQFKWETIKNTTRKFKIKYPFKENTNYQLFIPPATFKDIYGLDNDTVNINFKTKKEADYGNLFLKVNSNFSENYIVQLYKNKVLVKEDYLKGANKIDYNYLLSGNYSLKLIIDNNNDKKWNTGNYFNYLQPEKVFFYEKEIKIRANWDNDISWTVNK